MYDNKDVISFPCVQLTQPIGTFYVGAMKSADVVDIAWADVRRIAPKDRFFADARDEPEVPPRIATNLTTEPQQLDTDETFPQLYDQDFEEFLGIQRELSPSRVKELTQYVTNVDATFPTAVLLAVSTDHAIFDEATSTLNIVRHSKAAKVIDGQHRIAGLKGYEGPDFDVNVGVFVDMDIQDQAMVFATINLKQTKVNKSLAYDLYEFTKSRSPQKSAHDIARLLNYRTDSPFYRRIKMLGKGTGSGLETITQATFVDRLLRYISDDPMLDKDSLARRRKLERPKDMVRSRQIFRELFIDEQDAQIALILWNCFSAVQAKWPESWNNDIRGNILNRTTGFAALMRFMRVAYNSFERPSDIVRLEEFKQVFDRIDLVDGSFTSDEYLPGSSGERRLFDSLVHSSGLDEYR